MKTNSIKSFNPLGLFFVLFLLWIFLTCTKGNSQTLKSEQNNFQISQKSVSFLNKVQINTIVMAIYKIEGGSQTKYPFGIKSIDTHGDFIKSKKICENTVIHNFSKWEKSKQSNYFIFLADVYCPVKCDPIGNSNWKKNIFSILKKDFVKQINLMHK